MSRLPGLFVVGSDTGVGKTFVSAALIRRLVREGRRPGAIKPVATGLTIGPDGAIRADDPDILRSALPGDVSLDAVCPLLYQAPLAPPVAARLEGKRLDHAEVLARTRAAIGRWGDTADCLIVEGVGGWLCPLGEDSTVADLAAELDYPIVIVARRGLGTLNHTLLTVASARSRGLRIAGVILNGSEPTSNPLAESTNRAELSRRLGETAVLAEIPHATVGEGVDLLLSVTDWYNRCQPSRRSSL